MDDAISRIEAALKAEPSAGPWTVLPAIAGEQCVARINALEVVPPTGIELARDFIDADYIAACNPVAIRALLDRLKAAEASDAESIAMYRRARDERDRLKAAEAENERLTKAHAHQHEMAGLMLREAEKANRENVQLREALDALGVAIADAGYTWTPEMRAAYEKGAK